MANPPSWPKTDPKRASAGRAAQYHGDAWETWVEGQLAAAVYLGIVAHFEHSEPHAKMIRGQWTPVDPGVADFFGALEGGRALAIECKSVSGEYMQRSIVQKEQAEQLDAVARAGGLALLAGEFRSASGARVRFAAPWLEIPWETRRTAESVSPRLVLPWQMGGEAECFLRRWHLGGKRSGTWSPVKQRMYAVE